MVGIFAEVAVICGASAGSDAWDAACGCSAPADATSRATFFEPAHKVK